MNNPLLEGGHDGRVSHRLQELATAYDAHKSQGSGGHKQMKLITYVKDHGGITAGRSQFYPDEQAERLITSGIGFDANNGDRTHGEVTEYGRFLQRVEDFKRNLGKAISYPSIGKLEPCVNNLEQTFKELADTGEWPQKSDDLKRLKKLGKRLADFETQAEDRETVISRWLPGGVLRQQKEMKLNADMQRANAMILSPSENERQRGEALRLGVEQKFKEMDTLVDDLKAQLDKIRG
jgi:hypothetical protein